MSDAVAGGQPGVSVVVPVYNESPTLVDLHVRLVRVLKDVGCPWEIVFVDDGSVDGSADVLRALHAQDPGVRVVRLARNFGQHAALLAGFERARGQVVVTLDADLQNPPEEIPRLLARAWEGVDVVGSVRHPRRDGWGRRVASWAMNRVASAIVGVPMHDYGCMLRAYRRPVVEAMLRSQDASPFLPGLACTVAASVDEVPVRHEARRHGRSRYGARRLVRLGADLLTGFSTLPLDLIGLAGLLVTATGGLAGLALGVRWVATGVAPGAAAAVIVAVLAVGGLQLVALGVIAQYVGRAYRQARERPRYVVAETLG